MLPTVGDLLGLDVIRRGSPQVIAGSGGLGARFRWVHALELAVARVIGFPSARRAWTAAGSSVEDLAGAFDDGSLATPREVDPAIGALPDVIALDQRLWLLVDHGRAHVFDMVLDEGVDEFDGSARVGDVVGDEHLLG